MARIVSRILLFFALLAASLAWTATVFTRTIGDPERAERIASAVLADDDARAEITAPITSAVMTSTGLPPEQAPLVDAAVDQVLRDPGAAQAFVAPFAASWARLLGEDDSRATEFDLAPIVDDVERQLAAFGVDADFGAVGDADRVEVPDVPLPETELSWMGSTRRAIDATVLPLAVAAAGLAVAAFAIGDQRRVTRRIGIWGAFAGGLWLIGPPLLVWAARSWAPGADDVTATALDEATAGLRLTAVVLASCGAALVAASLALPANQRAAHSVPDRPVVRTNPPGGAPAPTAGGSAGRRTAPIPTTGERSRPPPARPPPSPPAPSPSPAPSPPPTDDGDGDGDQNPSVWDYYR